MFLRSSREIHGETEINRGINSTRFLIIIQHPKTIRCSLCQRCQRWPPIRLLHSTAASHCRDRRAATRALALRRGVPASRLWRCGQRGQRGQGAGPRERRQRPSGSCCCCVRQEIAAFRPKRLKKKRLWISDGWLAGHKIGNL